MDKYDPLVAPNAKEWLSLDEQERVNLVSDYHANAGVDLPNEQLHAIMHSIVENQVAEGAAIPVSACLDRLMREGLDRHDAIHAIASVLAQFLYSLINEGEAAADDNEKYYQELERLTAERWLESWK